WSKENVKTRTTGGRTIENKRLRKTSSLEQHQRHLTCRGVVRLELIPRPENFPISSNRFLALQYANEDRLKIALSSISNGALVCLTCVASSGIAKRQTQALDMINEEKKK
ncbi:conserved hypothetical protein, partial [Trichinella spiralis]|uniref:hypothetical protein n=1 Tax=Trichinella spiralis TaxID=6334 RepID=UPI0001EFEE39